MAPSLPSFTKPKAGADQLLLPPSLRHGSAVRPKSRSRQLMDRICAKERQRSQEVGNLDNLTSRLASASSTRLPSEASSRPSSRASSVASSRASSRAPSPSSSSVKSVRRSPNWVGVLDGEWATSASRASSVVSSRASSRTPSPSSSQLPLSARERPKESSRQRRLDYAPLPPRPLAAVARRKSLQPSTKVEGAKISDSCALPSKPPFGHKEREVDVEDLQKRLEQACHAGDINAAKICHLRGASLSQRLKSGEAPLHCAVRSQHYAFVEFLEQYGVSMNKKDSNGWTALHVAAANNDDEAVCRLIELGAKHHLQDNKGFTALHTAAAAGHMKAAEMLLRFAVDVNIKDKIGWTALSHAEFNDHFELADRIVERGGQDPLGLHTRSHTEEPENSGKSDEVDRQLRSLRILYA